MEHTFSLHDSTPEPSPEPFEVPSSHDAYQEPTPLHPFAAAEAVSVDDGWVQEEVPDEFEPEAAVEVERHEHEHNEHQSTPSTTSTSRTSTSSTSRTRSTPSTRFPPSTKPPASTSRQARRASAASSCS